MDDIEKKREEIQEGMVNVVKPYMIRGLYSGWDYAILKYLHDNDVVIKGDRELESSPICDDYMNGLGFLVEHDRVPSEVELDRFVKAMGYVAVGPLIVE